MSRQDKNILPHEEAAQARAWTLPELGGPAKRLPSAEKEAREAERRRRRAELEKIEEAPKRKPPTAAEIAEVMESARREGHAEGFGAGRLEGLAEGRRQGEAAAHLEARQAIEAQMAAFDQVLQQLRAPLEGERAQLVATLVSLTGRLTRALVQTELATPGAHLKRLVESALAALPVLESNQMTRVWLNPDDLAYIQGEAEHLTRLEGCQLLLDTSLSPGGCKVARGASSIDARVEVRLDELLRRFQLGNLLPESEPEAGQASEPPAQDLGAGEGGGKEEGGEEEGGEEESDEAAGGEGGGHVD